MVSSRSLWRTQDRRPRRDADGIWRRVRAPGDLIHNYEADLIHAAILTPRSWNAQAFRSERMDPGIPEGPLTTIPWRRLPALRVLSV